MMGWQWHQLDHMQVICTLLQTDNHASTSSLKFLRAGCPSCHPTNSVKALKEYKMNAISNITVLAAVRIIAAHWLLSVASSASEGDRFVRSASIWAWFTAAVNRVQVLLKKTSRALVICISTSTKRYNTLNPDIRVLQSAIYTYIQSILTERVKHSKRNKPVKKWHEEFHLQSPLDIRSAVEVTQCLDQVAPTTSYQHHIWYSCVLHTWTFTCNVNHNQVRNQLGDNTRFWQNFRTFAT